MPKALLRDLYGTELRDLWNAEKQLLVALPRMARSATASFLRQALTNHARQTSLHARRLEWMCEGLNLSMNPKRCAGMEGLVAEVRSLLMGDYSGDVLDAGLTASALRITQYKIVSYATVHARALQLGFPEQAALLENTLTEEMTAHETLGMVASAFYLGPEPDPQLVSVATAPAERRRDDRDDPRRREESIPDPDGSGRDRPDSEPPPPRRGSPDDPRDLEPEDRPPIRRDEGAAALVGAST